MTLLCYLFAAVAFLVGVVQAPSPAFNQGRMIALGLLLWILPAVLTAAHIAHS